MARTDLITKKGPNGPVVLAKRVWDMLADVEKEVGLKAGTLQVSQGSYRPKTPYSGTTHTGGGALDVRVHNLTDIQKAAVVFAFRRRNCAAWLRDRMHGGFAPHIHVIVMDEPDLGKGAAWQVKEFRAGRDGLSKGGPDYHPRPTPRHWPWPVVKPKLAPFPGNFSEGAHNAAVSSLRYSLGLTNPGWTTWRKGDGLSDAIKKWFVTHPYLLLRGCKPSVVDKTVYASITSKFPK